MDIAIGKQTDEVNLVVLAGSDHLPCLAPDITGAKGFFHLLGTLVEDATGSHDVVTHLGVTHIGIGGKPNGHTMGANREGNNGLTADVASNGCM